MRTARTGRALLTIVLLTQSACFSCFWKAVAQPTELSPSANFSQNEAQLQLPQIMDKVYLAYGGRDTLSRLHKNSTFLGEKQFYSQQDEIKIASVAQFRQSRKGDCLRIDLEEQNGWTSTVFDGTQAWKIDGKIVTSLTPEMTQVLSAEKFHEPAVLALYNERGYNFKLLGATTYRAVPVYALEISGEGIAPIRVFVDRNNFLVSAIQYDVNTPENTTTITIDYAEYRLVDGSLVAGKISEFVGTKPTVTSVIQQVELVQSVDDSLFRRPDNADEYRLNKPIAVPFNYAQKEIIVKVNINDGEPLDFLLDTGALQTIIDRRVAAENLLDQKADLNIIGAAGNTAGLTTVVKKLRLGEIVVQDTAAVILDLSGHAKHLGRPIAGILGSNFLTHFAVTINYGASQIVLRDALTYKAPEKANVINFQFKKGPIIKALLNGKDEVHFLIDSGAAFNNLPGKFAQRYQQGQPQRFTEGVGVDGRTVRLGTVNVSSVKIGAALLRDVPFTYSQGTPSPTSIRDQGFIAGETGILGNPVLQSFTLTLDYKLQHLILQPNTKVTSIQEIDKLITSGDTALIIQRDFRSAESSYQNALTRIETLGDPKLQARVWGRLGNLRRVMAKDLSRPEQARIAYEYFSKSQQLARKCEDREGEGRILGDWSLLYLDNGQLAEARQALDSAIMLAPQDPQVHIDFAAYLYKMRMFPEMRAYIDKALFLQPSNWQALWYRLKLCETFGDTGMAKDTLKDILRHYPSSKVARDKLNALINPASLSTPSAVINSYPVKQPSTAR